MQERLRDSKDIIRRLKKEGWYPLKSNSGDHHQFKHPTLPGKVTVDHPRKDLPWKTVQSIYRQAGWLWK
jgi:predicted RNA binding protein YcfA (HicA-like mRNA interferase family)